MPFVRRGCRLSRRAALRLSRSTAAVARKRSARKDGRRDNAPRGPAIADGNPTNRSPAPELVRIRLVEGRAWRSWPQLRGPQARRLRRVRVHTAQVTVTHRAQQVDHLAACLRFHYRSADCRIHHLSADRTLHARSFGHGAVVPTLGLCQLIRQWRPLPFGEGVTPNAGKVRPAAVSSAGRRSSRRSIHIRRPPVVHRNVTSMTLLSPPHAVPWCETPFARDRFGR